MSLLVKITLAAALILSIVVPFGAFAMGEKTKGRYKTALGINVFLFFGTLIVSSVLMFSGNAFAAEAAADGLCRCCSFYRYVLYRWWYRRIRCCFRCIRCDQRGRFYPW